jgi:hypothetical protein
MTRPLIYVAAVGIGTAVISLSLAAMLRGPSSFPSWSGDGIRLWGYGSGKGDSSSGEIVSRDYEWTGGDTLELNLPVRVRFRPAPTWHLSARGTSCVLDLLRADSGSIGMKGGHCANSGLPDIELSGPDLANLKVNGSGEIVLDQLKQENLDIRIFGSGTVKANGSVDSLVVNISGSGDAVLGALTAQSADVSIFGSGDVDVKPIEDARIHINGSGDVRLHARPKHLDSRVNGSGSIVERHAD